MRPLPLTPMSKTFLICALAVTAASALWAQSTSGGASQAPPASTAPRGNSSSSPPAAPSLGDTSSPMYVSGRVVTGDGSELPQNVAIVRVCSNIRHTLGYANAKGQFNVRVNSGAISSDGIADASEPGRNDGPFGSVGTGTSLSGATLGGSAASQYPLVGCELQVSATGFRAPPIDLSSRRPLDESEVGTIVLTRVAAVDGTSVSATTLSAPKAAQQAFQKGEDWLQKSKPEQAVKEFEKATSLYPRFAAAWLDLGRARARLKDDPGAVAALQKSVDADPKLADSWTELGLAQLRLKNWEDASKNLDPAVHLNPAGYPQLWFFNAVANFNAQHFEAAEKSAREALRLDPNHSEPRSDQILAMVLYEKNDVPGALDALRSYLKYAKDPPDAAQVQKQIGELENILATPATTR